MEREEIIIMCEKKDNNKDNKAINTNKLVL